MSAAVKCDVCGGPYKGAAPAYEGRYCQRCRLARKHKSGSSFATVYSVRKKAPARLVLAVADKEAADGE